jgi:hypothetical protein
MEEFRKHEGEPAMTALLAIIALLAAAAVVATVVVASRDGYRRVPATQR